MNMGYVPPKPGFLGGLRKVATEIGALLIFDEVKTCGKWYAGAEEAFGVTPDVKVLGKAIGGGFPLAAVGGSRSIMDQVVPGQIGHAGTFNANPLSISAGLVTMTKILTRSGMRHAQQIGDDLAKGYRDISGDHGLEMVVQAGGIRGAGGRTAGRELGWEDKAPPGDEAGEVPILQGRETVSDSQGGDFGFSPMTALNWIRFRARGVGLDYRRSSRIDQARGRKSSRSSVKRNSCTSRILNSGPSSVRNSSSLTTGGPLTIGSLAFPARVNQRVPLRVTRPSILRKPSRFPVRMPW